VSEETVSVHSQALTLSGWSADLEGGRADCASARWCIRVWHRSISIADPIGLCCLRPSQKDRGRDRSGYISRDRHDRPRAQLPQPTQGSEGGKRRVRRETRSCSPSRRKSCRRVIDLAFREDTHRSSPSGPFRVHDRPGIRGNSARTSHPPGCLLLKGVGSATSAARAVFLLLVLILHRSENPLRRARAIFYSRRMQLPVVPKDSEGLFSSCGSIISSALSARLVSLHPNVSSLKYHAQTALEV